MDRAEKTLHIILGDIPKTEEPGIKVKRAEVKAPPKGKGGLVPKKTMVRGPTKTFMAIRYISQHPDKVDKFSQAEIEAKAKTAKSGEKYYAGVNTKLIKEVTEFKEPAETGIFRIIERTDGKYVRQYTDKHKERSARSKLKREAVLSKHIGDIRDKYEKLMDSKDGFKKSLGTAVAVCDKLCIRVGGGGHGVEGHFGTTTLEVRHIETDPDGKMRLHFVGKSGVEHNIEITDPKIKEKLAELTKGRSPNARIFGPIERTDVQRFLRRWGVVPKDFRNYHASEMFHELATSTATPKKRKDAKLALKEMIIKVAAKLGHTPSVCKSKYINPVLIEEWLAGTLGRVAA